MVDNINRRDYFRLDDVMQLRLKKLSDEEQRHIELNFDAYRINHCLSSHLSLQREKRKGKLAIVRKRSAELAAYLELLEEDLVLLADRLKADNEHETTDSPKRVNLSSSSIRLESEEKYEPGQIVELYMTLSTAGTNIVLLANVTRVESSADDNVVSLQFVKIHPDDEEAIIRHMAKLQQRELQQRRNS